MQIIEIGGKFAIGNVKEVFGPRGQYRHVQIQSGRGNQKRTILKQRNRNVSVYSFPTKDGKFAVGGKSSILSNGWVYSRKADASKRIKQLQSP
jgi:hypothetical protein